jgi:flagellar hook-associated protein 2
MATSSIAPLSSAGIGSGLDVKSIISSLMAVEAQPLNGLQDKATKINSKLSSYGTMQSYVSALGDAASKLAQSSTWAQTAATSSDDTKVGATVTQDAVAGSYDVQVTALAAAQSVSSAGVADPKTAAGLSGNLRLEMGSYLQTTDPDTGVSTTTFNPINYPSWVDVAISSSDSIEGVRDKINAASSGVTASIVTDSSGSRLIVRSKTTGAESAFRITATDDGTSTAPGGLAAYGYDGSQASNPMMLNKAASDATAVIDGLSVTSQTNTFSGALQGVTFVAKAITSTPVSLSVSSDSKSMSDSVNAFAKAYNDLASYLKAQTKYDADTKAAGTLQGDSGANALRSALRSLGTSSAGASDSFSRLSEIGLDPQGDGTLKVNSTKLSAAVTDPANMQKLFGGNDASSDTDDGFASRINDWSRALLGVDGAVTTRKSSLQSQLRANTKDQANFNDRLTAIQARLTAQYNALDTQMSQISSLSNYVTQQVANWNKSSS